MELKELESAIEGILFAAGDPMPVERLCLVLEQDRETVDSVCQRLADQYSYERRGIRLVKLENCWQMCSARWKTASPPGCPSRRWRYWLSSPIFSR